MTGDDMPGPPGSVRPPVALGLGVVSYVALAIFGLGMTSLLYNRDVIDVPALGQLPGAVGMGASTGFVALAVWIAVRRPHPSYAESLGAALGAYLGYLVGVLIAALATDVGPARAVAAVGAIASSWFGLVLALAGLIAAWGTIALVRTRAGRPHWPWEGDEDE